MQQSLFLKNSRIDVYEMSSAIKIYYFLLLLEFDIILKIKNTFVRKKGIRQGHIRYLVSNKKLFSRRKCDVQDLSLLQKTPYRMFEVSRTKIIVAISYAPQSD